MVSAGMGGPRKVVTTGSNVMATPSRDTMPKVHSQDPMSKIQTAPVMKSRQNVSAQKRDNLLKPEVQFVNNGAPGMQGNQVSATTDLIHAKANANTYMKMQSQMGGRRARTRPSDMLKSNEVV